MNASVPMPNNTRCEPGIKGTRKGVKYGGRKDGGRKEFRIKLVEV